MPCYLRLCLVWLLLSPVCVLAASDPAAATFAANAIVFSRQLTRVNDHPLFSLEYTGPYPDREGLFREVVPLVLPQVMCTTFAAYPAPGSAWFGRNYDFNHHPALVLVTRPADGYASVSLVDLGFLGYSDEEALLRDPGRLRYAPYVPTDGMNEHGLAVAVMYMPETQAVEIAGKPSLLSLEAVRVVLDHARTTEEAIRLLARYNIAFPGLPVHYLIADAAGRSAVVEYVEGRMRVVRNSRTWQAATNFKLYQAESRIQNHRLHYRKTGRTVNDPGNSYLRYLAVENVLNRPGEPASPEKALRLLESVAVKAADRTEAGPLGTLVWKQGWFGTQWSAVYDLSRRSLSLALGSDFRQTWQVSLAPAQPFILIPAVP